MGGGGWAQDVPVVLVDVLCLTVEGSLGAIIIIGRGGWFYYGLGAGTIDGIH